MLNWLAALPNSFPVFDDESGRLAVLASLDILGSGPSLDFDSILSLALKVTCCPFGSIGMIDAERHWLKAERGAGCREMPRAMSLCGFTLLQSDPLIVENLSLDERFTSNPFVVEKGARFYAGVAIAQRGYNIGTLCVVDVEEREGTSALVETMRDLGRIAEGLIEAHAQAAKAKAFARLAEESTRAIWQKNRLVAQIERVAKIGAWEHDLRTGALQMSDECYRIHGLALGTPVDVSTVRLLRTPPFRARAQALYDECIKSGANYDLKGEIVTTQGERRWIETIVEAETKDGLVVRHFGTVRNVTAEHQAERILWRAAHYDALTGAPNRYNWTIKFARAFEEAAKYRFPLAILVFDLDGFKEINDTSGHPAGDVVLREIASRIAAALPPDSFHARLGGDEFAILLVGPVATDDLEKTAQAMLAAMRKPIKIGPAFLQVSGTFGGATYPKDGETADDLMKKADIALYQAKHSQRSSFLPFRPEIGAVFDDKRRAMDSVASALDSGRLVPFYQPKVHIESGAILGFEALVRIEAADGTISGPSRFYAALEDAALSARIGVAMLDQVTADIAQWRRDGYDPGRIAINTAGSDFTDGHFPDRLLARLEALNLPPSALELEIVENTLIGQQAGTVLSALRRFREAGIFVSLDDFGTGYASLTHLRDTPIQCIKIDRSFVAGLGIASNSAVIVRSLVDLGHDLDLWIVAEGVETDKQLAFLKDIGCDAAQGFLFGRPASHAATTAILERRDARPLARGALAG